MNFIHRYDSPLGGITEASDGKFLIGLWFDGQKYFADTLDFDYEEKRLRHETEIKDLNPDVLMERRRGLEWLISEESNWFDISMDT